MIILIDLKINQVNLKDMKKILKEWEMQLVKINKNKN